MRMKKRRALPLVTVFLFLLLFGACITVQGAVIAPTELATEQTYQKYDINGDGTSDKLQITCAISNDQTANTRILVNGKLLWQKKTGNCTGSRVVLFSSSDGQIYLNLKEGAANDHILSDLLLTYSGGKLVTAADLQKMLRNTVQGRWNSQIVHVSGSQVKVLCTAMPNGLGQIQYNATYQLKGKTAKLTSTIMKVVYSKDAHPFLGGSNRWTTTRSLNGHKSVKDASVVCKAAKNETIKINWIYFGKSYTWVKIQNAKGQGGWVRCPLKSSSNSFVKEAFFI